VPLAPRVRLARPEDALAVAGVHVRAWQAAYEGLIDSSFLAALREEDRAATYSFGSTDPWAPEMIVATEGAEILGFASFGRSRDADAPDAGEIRALYVDPSRWGGGVGQLLLHESRERLRQQGYADAILWVLVGNERAARFYGADGWRRDGAEREEQPYGVVSHVVRYRRPLDD
jgi:GNAT superfamily N-acetyltransferase